MLSTLIKTEKSTKWTNALPPAAKNRNKGQQKHRISHQSFLRPFSKGHAAAKGKLTRTTIYHFCSGSLYRRSLFPRLRSARTETEAFFSSVRQQPQKRTQEASYWKFKMFRLFLLWATVLSLAHGKILMGQGRLEGKEIMHSYLIGSCNLICIYISRVLAEKTRK